MFSLQHICLMLHGAKLCGHWHTNMGTAKQVKGLSVMEMIKHTYLIHTIYSPILLLSILDWHLRRGIKDRFCNRMIYYFCLNKAFISNKHCFR